LIFLAFLRTVAWAQTGADASIRLDGGTCRVEIDPRHGTLMAAGPSGGVLAILKGGEQGLWRLSFDDGSVLDAAQFRAGEGERRVTVRRDAATNRVELTFDAPEAVVVAHLAAIAEGIDLSAKIHPRKHAVLTVELPARLRFSPNELVRLTSPLEPHEGIGAAFRRSFFERQPQGTQGDGSPGAAVRPAAFLEHRSNYPPLFADWVHLETTSGTLAVYRVQPRGWTPWQGYRDASALFVPGRAAFGGDAQGGWIERSFATFVAPGTEWTTPVVRLAAGKPAIQSLNDYAAANGLRKQLRQKLPQQSLDRFRSAVLVKYDGTARDMIAGLPKLPVPCLIHISDYLKGGFDKEYPDHLPPHPSFGTPEELRALWDKTHALGHLIMPYTNPTWWCDHPRGPTFLAAGEDPLARGLDGKLHHEQYGRNDGWITTPWHASVQAANRVLRNQFTRDYPVDILFQDQCGARTWVYDTNPRSPRPHAYAEGLLSQLDEDARIVPLSTEDGFDRVLDDEVQLCGFTFALVPGETPSWARPLKTLYPEGTWEIYPVAQILAHDKVAMLHHDLGKFVSDRRTLTWTLGLGFAMSDRLHTRALADPQKLEWLRWLDRVQKSICRRYVGEPLESFRHEPGHGPDDGLIRARYGPVEIVANLGPNARQVGDHVLAPHGFFAEAQGMLSGDLARAGGVDLPSSGLPFVVEGNVRAADLWVLAAPGAEAASLVPQGMTGRVELIFDGQPGQDVVVLGALPLKLPAGGGAAATQSSAPRLWHAQIRALSAG
jgi:hypothetical protein